MKPLRVFGHPVHPALTDFPLALLSISLFGDILGLVQGDPFWWRASFWLIAAGSALSLPTVATGFLDYLAIPQEDPARDTGTWHMIVMLAAVSLYGLSLVVRRVPEPVSGTGAWLAVGLSALGFLSLVAGGWLGGELVFGHGIGSIDGPGQDLDINE